MPSNEIHCLIDKLLFGKDGRSVHKWMDEPHKWLGNKHRNVRHDIFTVAFLQMTKGKEAAMHAVSHILTDKLLTKSYNSLNSAVRKALKNAFKINL